MNGIQKYPHLFYGIIFIVISPLLLNNYAFAQKEGNNWFFGNYAGVTFNSGKSVALTTGSLKADFGGSASISTPKGRLMYYSDGFQVYDSLHSSLSLSLKGTNANPQTALFVPNPDSSNIYYVFNAVNSISIYSLFYSVIDTRLRSGRGDIVKGRNNMVLFNPSCAKLTAVKHANRKDYWVLTHKYNSDTICAFLVTSAGVNPTPVYSRTGYKVSTSNSLNSVYPMKMSPDGKWVCSANASDSSIIAHFDAATGKVSNAWSFDLVVCGMEFSAKSRYLYTIESGGNTRLYQYDLSKPTRNMFNHSRRLIDSAFGNTISLIQLAPDEKIYIPTYQSLYLHVIHQPDNVAEKVKTEKNYLFLDYKTATTGLPDMIQSLFHKPNFNVKPNCSRDTVFFSISNSFNLDSAHWDFGDSSSGSLNYLRKTSGVFHCYSKPGTYLVRLISYHKQFIDTIYETVEVNYSKPWLGKDTSLCNSFKLTLSPKGLYKSYRWSNNSTGKTLTATRAGTYWISTTDYDGCISSDSILIKNPIITARIEVFDSTRCFKNHSFILKTNNQLKGDSPSKTAWRFSDGTTSSDTIVNKKFAQAGVYSVTLVSESTFGCKDSASQSLKVFPNTIIGFNVNQSDQCVNNNLFNFDNTSINTDSLSYNWDLGDQQSAARHIIAKTYNSVGKININLITLSTQGCKDTLTKVITLSPAPKADFSWLSNCSQTPISFLFSGNIPTSPISTSYLWYFPDQDSSKFKNPSKLLDQPGINKVTLTLRSDNGCQSSVTKYVEVLPQAKAAFDANDVCEDSLVLFNNVSIGGVSYDWKFGDGNISKIKSPIHKYVITGISRTFNVSLTVFVPGGCSDSITKAVTVNANPKSDFKFNISGRMVNFLASEIGASNYQWAFGDGGNANSTTPNTSYHYTKFPSGKYKACLKVTNAANCFSETCNEINITGGFASINSPGEIQIYPNPNSGNFTIEVKEPKDNLKLELFNSIGQRIYTSPLEYGLNLLDLDIPDGIYFLNIVSGEKVFKQNIIVTN